MQHTRPSSQGRIQNPPGSERASETTSACLDELSRAPGAGAARASGPPKNVGTGAGLALSVAALFVAACQQRSAQETPAAGGASTSSGEAVKSMPAPPDPKSGNVQCLGIHECKGKSACHVIGSHACAGLNTCKGKGWIAVPATECESKGGKVLDS